MTESDIPPVGYMTPPEHTRFQKGTSGNPHGRPRKRKDLNTVLQQVLRRKVRIKDKEQKIQIQDALIWKLRELALQGDKRALALQRQIIAQAGLAEVDLRSDADLKARLIVAFEGMGIKVIRDE